MSKSSTPAAVCECLPCPCYPLCVIVLTRCSSCEYIEGCEWRAKKAREAQEKYLKRSQMEDTGELDTT